MAGVTSAPRPMTAGEWALLVALGAVWGGSFFFNRVAVQDLPVFTIVGARVALAALILVIVQRLRGEALPAGATAWRALFVMAVLNNVLPFSLIVWGQQYLASGVAAILNAATPLFTVVFAHWLTRDEKLSSAKLAGVVVGFVGVAVMLGFGEGLGAGEGPGAGAVPGSGSDPGSGEAPADGLPGAGSAPGMVTAAQLLCLAGAASYALAGIFGRRFRAMGLSPLNTATGQLLASSMLMVPAALAFDRPWTLGWPGAGTVGALVGLAVLSTALAYVMYFRILATAGATNLLLVTFLIPVGAILLGGLFLDETLGLRQFAGMALIGLGLLAIDGRGPARLIASRALNGSARAGSDKPPDRA